MTEIQWFGQSLINERISTHLESISSDTIKNAVAIFTDMKIIVNVKQEYNSQPTAMIKIGVPNFDYLHMIFKSIILVIIIGDFDKNTK